MLRVVVTRISKSRLRGNRPGLRKVRCRVFALGSWFTRKGSTSSSATSIGTKENSLRVPKARSRALIYMGEAKHRQREGIQVQRELSKYSYIKGDGHQEVSE